MKGLWLCVALAFNITAFSQEHIRILEHSTTYTIYDNASAEIEQYQRMEVLSDEGYEEAVYVGYFDKFRKVSDITVDVIDKQGNKVKRLKRNDGIEFGLSPSNEITDVTKLIIDPKYKQYPFVLEINANVKLDGFISMPTWVPRSQFHTAVHKSQLVIVRPRQVKINLREEHIKGVTQTDGNKIVTTFKVENLQAVDKKVRYKDFYEDQPKVLVSPENFRLDNIVGSSATWMDFGNWFLSLNSDAYKLSGNTKQFIDRLDKSNKANVVQLIYEYMQDKTRYVSIQLGIGGFKSLPVEDVDTKGYGDCKALSTYMKSMLQHAGISSNYILVRAGKDEPDVIADFPGHQFNHVYIGVPLTTDTLYLECTSQIAPINYTGTFTDDRNVLWIDNNKSSIIRSKIYDHRENVQNNFIKIAVDDEGNGLASFESINQGIFFDEVMIYKLAPEDFVKEYNQSKFDYSDYSLKKFTFNQPERDVPAFVSRFTVAINSLARSVGGKLVLPFVPATPFYKYIDNDEMQKFYSVKRGMTIADVIEVDLPDNYWVYNLPQPEKVITPYGSYTLEAEVDGDKLKLKRTMIFFKGEYKNERYDGFKTFFQAIEKVEKKKLVLSSKT